VIDQLQNDLHSIESKLSTIPAPITRPTPKYVRRDLDWEKVIQMREKYSEWCASVSTRKALPH
jgi:hypothetical protein